MLCWSKHVFSFSEPPRPLAHLCRIKIRSLVGKSRISLIDTLPLPGRLLRYLQHDYTQWPQVNLAIIIPWSELYLWQSTVRWWRWIYMMEEKKMPLLCKKTKRRGERILQIKATENANLFRTYEWGERIRMKTSEHKKGTALLCRGKIHNTFPC